MAPEKQPFGLFEFLRTPFGLKNATQALQRFIDTVCRGLEFVFVYLDDILLSSKSTSQHEAHLRTVFQRPASHGVVIDEGKCQFGATIIDYLGHCITSQGALPLPAKVDAIRVFARPTTVKGLQPFAGMVNFYHRFVPNAAHIMRHMQHWQASQSLLCGHTTSKKRSRLSETLARATMLVHPETDKHIALTVDASGAAIGAVLEQELGSWKPVAFFSLKGNRNNKCNQRLKSII